MTVEVVETGSDPSGDWVRVSVKMPRELATWIDDQRREARCDRSTQIRILLVRLRRIEARLT